MYLSSAKIARFYRFVAIHPDMVRYMFENY